MPGSFEDLLRDLFEPIGGVTIRRMFGGLGIMRNGLMFALVSRDVLYFKADAETEPDFAAEACGQWAYETKDKGAKAMPYWRAPERLFDDPDEFRTWALKASAAADRVRASKPAGKGRPKPSGSTPAAKRPATRKMVKKRKA